MKVKSYKDGSVGKVEVDEGPFGEKVLYRTLKDVVVNYMANQRQGNHATARPRTAVLVGSTAGFFGTAWSGTRSTAGFSSGFGFSAGFFGSVA